MQLYKINVSLAFPQLLIDSPTFPRPSSNLQIFPRFNISDHPDHNFQEPWKPRAEVSTLCHNKRQKAGNIRFYYTLPPISVLLSFILFQGIFHNLFCFTNIVNNVQV